MADRERAPLEALRWECLPEPARFALARLEERGFEAALVGGCVRDALLGWKPSDTDIATSALPGQVMEAFADQRVVPTGLKHGTVTLVRGGAPVEITTFRRDGDYSDMRRPDSVAFTGSLPEDVARRDFTMNALAWERRAGLIDHVGGVEDLSARIIRAVGDPRRRFSEDALRIIRALRFHAQLSGAFPGFRIEPETGAAIRALYGNLSHVAPERLWKELGRLIAANAGPVLCGYPEVFGMLLPCAAGFSPEEWGTACARLEALIRGGEGSPYARWAALLLDAGSEAAGETLRGLRAERRAIEEVGARIAIAREADPDMKALRRLVGEAMPVAARFCGEGPVRGKALEIVREAARVAFAFCADAEQEALRLLDEIERQGLACDPADLLVSGGDLAALGLRGPSIGETQRALLAAVIEGVLPNERAALLEQASRLM